MDAKLRNSLIGIVDEKISSLAPTFEIQETSVRSNLRKVTGQHKDSEQLEINVTVKLIYNVAESFTSSDAKLSIESSI